MYPHFSSEQRPLLCRGSDGFGGATCWPDYTGQSLPTGHTALQPLPAQGHEGAHPLSKPSSLPPSSPLSTPGNGDFRAIPVPQKPQAICVAQNTWMQTVSRESVLKAEIIMWRDDTVPVPLTLK